MDSSSKPSFALFSSPYHPSTIVSGCCCSRIAQRGFAGAASDERSPTSDPSKKAKGKHAWNKELGKIEDHFSLFWTTQELSQKKSPSGLGFYSLGVLLLLFLHNCCSQEHAHASPSVLPSPSPPASPGNVSYPEPNTSHRAQHRCLGNTRSCTPKSPEGSYWRELPANKQGGGKLIRGASRFSVAGSKRGCSNSAKLINYLLNTSNGGGA